MGAIGSVAEAVNVRCLQPQGATRTQQAADGVQQLLRVMHMFQHMAAGNPVVGLC